MGFSVPSKPKLPPIPDPTPIPEVAEGDEAKRLRKRKGYSSTILAGDLVSQNVGQTLLGGTI